jgi:hypothetical protein
MAGSESQNKLKEMKPRSSSSGGLKRFFGLFRFFGVFASDLKALGGLRSEAFGACGRFSPWLAQLGGRAKVQQNGRHHPTDLVGSKRTAFRFPRSVQDLGEILCQEQQVKGDGNQPTPALKLLRGAHMHVSPEKFLLEKAVIVLLRETESILLRDLGERDDLIKHHEPAQPRITLAAFGRFTLHADDFEVQEAVLLEMQVVPSTDPHGPAFAVLLQTNRIGLPMSFFALSLQERTVFGHRPTFMEPHSRTVELAIAFEADQDTVAQLLASTQELWCAVSPIRYHDHPTVPKQWPEATAEWQSSHE